MSASLLGTVSHLGLQTDALDEFESLALCRCRCGGNLEGGGHARGTTCVGDDASEFVQQGIEGVNNVAVAGSFGGDFAARVRGSAGGRHRTLLRVGGRELVGK